jgi:hypothetical protein
MHTGREGMSAMPYFDDFDLSSVDILLISQYVDSPFTSIVVQGGTPERRWHCLGVVVNEQSFDKADTSEMRPHTTLYYKQIQYNPIQPDLLLSILITRLCCCPPSLPNSPVDRMSELLRSMLTFAHSQFPP